MNEEFEKQSKEINSDGLIQTIEAEPRDNRYWETGRPRTPLPKGLKWAVGGLFILFIGGFGASIIIARNNTLETVSTSAGNLEAGIQDLQNLDPASAKQKFETLNGAMPAGGIVQILGSLFQDTSGAIGVFKDFSGNLGLLSQNVLDLEKNLFSFAITGNGAALIKSLTDIQKTLAAVNGNGAALADTANHLGGLSPISGDIYLPFKTEIAGAQSFLNSFIPWFSSSTPQHILVMFQNPSELRPGGGFLGSYADVTLQSGNVKNISVHDIADVDAAFTKNIIPPKALQPEISRFRPADANWFLDFPTTASETIAMFESSGLYANTSTTFDAAIAISPKVIEDLLSVTGPVTLAGGETFNADNLLVAIQKEVQAGQAQGATYPKKILTDLGTAIFAKVASSSDTVQQGLLGMVLDWMEKKDAMVYFKDPAMESFIAGHGAAGSIYHLPQTFNGDYLAIVNTNVNSDKSDLYVSQDVNFEANISVDGSVTNHLTIKRTHAGNKSPYPWYQTTNQDYLQIVVPPGTALENENGGIAKTITPKVNYAQKKYLTDPLIAAIESSTQPIFEYPAVSVHDEFGKRAFATWAVTRAGTATQIVFDYAHHLFNTPGEGTRYTFVYDKQPGTIGHYKFGINAPLGFKFAENNLPSYEYESDDIPGQVVVTLTLTKI